MIFQLPKPDQMEHSERDLECAETLCQLANIKSYRSFQVQVDVGNIRTVCDLIDSDKKLNTFTGLNSFKQLEVIEHLVRNVYEEKRVRRLLLRERVVLTFMKMKNDLSYVVLSLLFGGVSSNAVKQIFYEMLNILSTVLKPAIRFLNMSTISKYRPIIFQKFPNVRIILDCTEIPVSKPKCLCCRVKTYSHYKTTQTIKFMVGISPSGLITFVSKAYGGRASDKAIFEQSGILNKLNRGEAVMVDKGFLIDDACATHGVSVIRPPFLRKKKQLSAEEVALNRCISKARVHIERANQRLKIFKILRNRLNWPLVRKIDQIFTIICAVVNISNPLISNDKFM